MISKGSDSGTDFVFVWLVYVYWAVTGPRFRWERSRIWKLLVFKFFLKKMTKMKICRVESRFNGKNFLRLKRGISVKINKLCKLSSFLLIRSFSWKLMNALQLG